MATLYSPKIVTDGLVLCLDSGNTKSYTSGSTTWNDLTGNNNTGSLINGPTFTSSFGGSIVFDGVNDYVTLPTGFISSLTACTISCWFYYVDNGNWTRVFDFGTGTTFYMFLTPKQPGGGIRFAITTGGNSAGSEKLLDAPTSVLTSNTWYNVVLNLNGSVGNLYLNGNFIVSNSIALTPNSLGSTTQNYIGKSQYADPYFLGNFATMLIYNRVLTASEVLQNYNANKGRFGL
jgi:hypothetical protein